jgi:Holliday junction resolvase
MEWIQPIITLGSIIAAILAWAAKILWAKEFKTAKEAQIAVLKEQITGLERLNPKIIHEFAASSVEQIKNQYDRAMQDLELIKTDSRQDTTTEYNIMKIQLYVAQSKLSTLYTVSERLDSALNKNLGIEASNHSGLTKLIKLNEPILLANDDVNRYVQYYRDMAALLLEMDPNSDTTEIDEMIELIQPLLKV